MKLRTLAKAEAWDLFCRKAFVKLDENRCPESLKYWAEKIVEKCQGLPLAIVAIGSLLAYQEKKEDEWRSFYNQLNWQLENNPELNLVARIVDLPSYLKNCFLYCGLFPKDVTIDRDWIIRLWIAEGFIEQRGPRMTMEEVGEVYINELVHRCLLQVVERDEFGRVKALKIHDVVREISLTKSRKEMFGIAYDNTEIIQLGDEARRAFINRGSEIILQPSTGSQQLLSFLLFDNHLSSPSIHNILPRFRLLRVLSLRGAKIDRVPDAVAELFNLSYLDLSDTEVKTIPRWLGKLLNLQTLDLRGTCVLKLPKKVTMLQKLRHLYVSCLNGHIWKSFDYMRGASVPDEICSIRSLQTLHGIEASRLLVHQIGNMTLLSELIILKMRRSYCEALRTSLAKIPRLRMLSVYASNPSEILNLENIIPRPSLQYMDFRGRLKNGARSLSIFSSFENLRDLTIGWSGLSEDPLPALSSMSNLVTLKLHSAYDGQRLNFLKGWFPNLKNLYLINMLQLDWINIEDGTMKNLQELNLLALQNLDSVPIGIKYLKSIQKLSLSGMPEVFMERLRVQDRKIVEHIHNIHNK